MTLEELRTSKGLSRSVVAQRMGMTYHNIMRLETSGTAPVTTLEEYAKALGCDFVTAWEASRHTRGLPVPGLCQTIS